jgi:hypothetical protein
MRKTMMRMPIQKIDCIRSQPLNGAPYAAKKNMTPHMVLSILDHESHISAKGVVKYEPIICMSSALVARVNTP